MKVIILLALLLHSTVLFSQNGYVTLKSDSTLVGYLRYYVSVKDGLQGIEVWRTKNDKTPLKILKHSIAEYAIKKDTFKVLQHYKPFIDSDTYFEIIDAKVVSRGKVNLFKIENYQNPKRVSVYTQGGLVPAVIDLSLGNYTYMYLLEDKASGNLQALSSKKDKLRESLLDFFPEKYINRYQEEKGEITYKSLPGLVTLYNSK